MPEHKILPEEVPIMAALIGIGWTPKKVATVFGVTRNTVIDNVTGKRKSFRLSTEHQEVSEMSEIVMSARKAGFMAMARALREAANELDPPEQPLTEHAQALKVS